MIIAFFEIVNWFNINNLASKLYFFSFIANPLINSYRLIYLYTIPHNEIALFDNRNPINWLHCVSDTIHNNPQSCGSTE